MTTVLVTRPRHQQARFLQLCADEGFKTQSLPLLNIQAVTVDDSLWVDRADDPYTAWVYTSANAVEHSPVTQLVAGSVFAMGASTSAALKKKDIKVAEEPDYPFNSEALVAQLRARNIKTVVVVTGIGGRAYLAAALEALGCEVIRVACYERLPVEHAPSTIENALRAADILSLTSIESMDSLLLQAKSLELKWMDKPMVVNSHRAKTAAESAGFTGPIHVAYPAGDDGQILALQSIKSEVE